MANERTNDTKETGHYLWLVKTASSDVEAKTNTPHWRRRDLFVVADTAAEALRHVEGVSGVKAEHVRSVTIAGRRSGSRVWAEELAGD